MRILYQDLLSTLHTSTRASYLSVMAALLPRVTGICPIVVAGPLIPIESHTAFDDRVAICTGVRVDVFSDTDGGAT